MCCKYSDCMWPQEAGGWMRQLWFGCHLFSSGTPTAPSIQIAGYALGRCRACFEATSQIGCRHLSVTSEGCLIRVSCQIEIILGRVYSIFRAETWLFLMWMMVQLQDKSIIYIYTYRSPHLTTVDTVPCTDNEDMRPDGRKFALIHFARDPQIRHGHRPSVCDTCCAPVLRSAPTGAVECSNFQVSKEIIEMDGQTMKNKYAGICNASSNLESFISDSDSEMTQRCSTYSPWWCIGMAWAQHLLLYWIHALVYWI